MIAHYVPFAIGAILIAAIVIELRTGRIPNWLTLLPFIAFIGVAATTPDKAALGWQLGLAAAVFAVGILLFVFGGFGAGAVKLMAGLALFVPLDKGGYALIVFGATLFVGTFVMINLRRMVGSPDSNWNVLAKNVLPMSVPIGLAGLAALFWL
ncbi:prepilin peptidase [Yoonia sp.]|uniref:prepilin peptidase n=1 Tax=Yoonia sp. TaxID=2212373 RepID=UPI0025DA6851|nr:prepilin peptidase [Yoonia sp.]